MRAPVDDTDVEGNTVLHVVASKGLITVASILLRAGADPTQRNGNGLTPMQLAAAAGHAELESMMGCALL